MPRTRRRASAHTLHYQAHKEAARTLIHERLAYYNAHYQLSFNRVAVRNTRRCWGSCTSLGNLNFNYKLLFLPERHADYIIVHELCHLKELNHSSRFWDLVAETLPDYKARRAELRLIDRGGGSVAHLRAIQDHYHAHTTVPTTQPFGVATRQ